MYISFINNQKNELCGEYQPNLHPFYTPSFTALYKLPNIQSNSNATRDKNSEWIINSLKRTLNNIDDEPTFFFDVRTTEDFSSPAPEYLILKNLNLKRTTPLNIKGMGQLAIVQAFQISDLYLTDGGTALFSVVEEYHLFDQIPRSQQGGFISSFLLTSTKGEMEIEEYGFFELEEKVICFLTDNKFDKIYTGFDWISEYPNTVILDCFFVNAFQKLSELNTQSSTFRVAFITKYKEKYGYYIIRKD